MQNPVADSISEDIRNEIKGTIQTLGGTDLHRMDVEKIFLLFRSLSSDGYPLLDVMVAITAAVRLVVVKKTVNPKKLSLLFQRNSLTADEIGLECEDFELLREMILRDFPPIAAAATEAAATGAGSSSSSSTFTDTYPPSMTATGSGAAAAAASSSSSASTVPMHPRHNRTTQGENKSSRTSPNRSRNGVEMSLPHRSRSSSVGTGAGAGGSDYRCDVCKVFVAVSAYGLANHKRSCIPDANGNDDEDDDDDDEEDDDGDQVCDICNDFVAKGVRGLFTHKRACIRKNGGAGSSSSSSGGGRSSRSSGGDRSSSSSGGGRSSSSSSRRDTVIPYDDAPFPLRLLPGSKNCEIGLDPDNPFQCDNNSKDYGKHITLPFCTVGCPDYVVTSGTY